MKKSTLKIVLSAIAIIVLLAISHFTDRDFSGHAEESSVPAEITTDALEMPQLSETKNDIYASYNGYAVSYNCRTRIPNWVAYELTKDETYGEASRSELFFKRDDSLPYPQADDYDYRNSGWSRGHMAPAGDFRWSDDAIYDTFYFTNCCPQDRELNEGMWNTLEKKTRTLARKYGKVWVVTGPITGKNIYGTIGKNRITVPDAFFKALLIKKGGSYHAIAFIMENRNLDVNMQSCAMSVNRLEEITGLNLFAALDNSIEEKVEEEFTLSVWNL